MESDREEEDSSPDELEESSDDEAADPSVRRKMKQSRTQNSGHTSTPAGFGVDVNDPPPPYEQ